MHRLLTTVTAISAALAACSPQAPVPAASPRQDTGPIVTMTPAPPDADGDGIVWVKVTAPGLGVMLAAVARPPGRGQFPTLIILHGTHGFAREYVRLARDIARNGVIAIAVCWFSGGSGQGLRYVTPIGCPDAPALTAASSTTAMRTVDAILQAVRGLPGVAPDQLALFGHSRGGGAALNYLLGKRTVQAVVLNSAGYPAELRERVSEIAVPILMLHGTADSPSDGGSALTDVRMARQFEAAMRAAGKTIEATYYEGGHNSIFTSAAQYSAEVKRIVGFLGAQTRRPSDVRTEVRDTTRTIRDTSVVIFFRDTTPAVPGGRGRRFNLQESGDRASLRTTLRKERELWRSAKPRDYRFLLRVGCFCPGTRGWLLMEVRSGQPLRAWDRTGRSVALTDWNTLSVDGVYDNLEQWVDRGGTVQIDFDPRWHFPRYISTNAARGPDAWSVTEAQALQPLR